MRDGGVKPSVIARFYEHPYSTIANTLLQDKQRNHGESLPRCGPPKFYSNAEERLVLRHVRHFPQDTYAEVIEASAVKFKKDTVKKILEEHGIENLGMIVDMVKVIT